jgi:hypothetical protein
MKVISKLNESFELINGFHDKYVLKTVYDDLNKKYQDLNSKNQDCKTVYDKLIDNLNGKIIELTTDLTYRDGLLNCRGIIQKTELKFCYSFSTYQNSSRKIKWKHILNEDRSLLNSLQTCVKNSNQDSLSEHITNLYKDLPNRIHNPNCGSKSIQICGNISTNDAKILACICKSNNINWESNLIDKNMIKIRVDFNRSFN